MSDSRFGYLSELADELAKVIQPYQVEDKVMEKVFTALPVLLKAFALSLGHGQSTPMHRETMVFIHKYRSDIVTAVKERLLDKFNKEEERQPENAMSLAEIMDLWQQKSEDSPHEQSEPVELKLENICDDTASPIGECQQEEEEEEEEEKQQLPRLEAYRTLVQNTPTYQWLLLNIRNQCTLYIPGQKTANGIKKGILESLPSSSRVSRQKLTESLSASFRIEWDAIRFLQEQEYQEAPEEAIERALTFTGAGAEVQAESCGEYLRRTWPSTGDSMVQLLKALVSPKGRGSVTLIDGTCIYISRQPSEVSENLMDTWIDARGTAACLAEIGEQLAWIASALQTRKLVTYPISIQVQYPVFDIGIEKHVLPVAAGSCWLGLVSSPAVAEGFPIQRRPLDCTPGLEAPIAVMAQLLNTRKVQRFDGRTIIKGFSRLLVPTGSIKDVISWHLVQKADDRRVSYLDSQSFPKLDIPNSQLEKARHILGWCPEVLFYAGAADAKYRVDDSKLPRCCGSQILKDVSLSSDHFITADAPCSLGRKDVRMRRNGYVSKMKWITERHITIWDVGEEKGWLVNGASGLLHLARASLVRDGVRSGAQISSRTHHPDSALEVLLDLNNLNLRLYRVDADVTLKDRIEDYYDQLEKMYDYQVNGLRNNGKPPRSLLEGWDFGDLVLERDPIYPRHNLLHKDGFCWVDFCRSINAITLFGRGFGEIIRPVTICVRTSILEPKKSYLAATMSDLNKIMAAQGDPYSIPMMLTHDSIWHPAEATFDCCTCRGQGHNHRAIAIQSLLPSRMRSEVPSLPSGISSNNGAVIFGFDKRNKWFWGETGPPSQVPARLEYDTPVKEPPSVYSDDSGLGKSLSSSADQETESSRSFTAPTSKDSSLRIEIPFQSYKRPEVHSAKDYKVGIVCALHIELMAVRALFDKPHSSVRIATEDPNYYALGRIKEHNIVAVCLPHGVYGTNAATDVASNMRRSFPSLKFCLLVGIGAGVPSSRNDIRLGDVVVSIPSGRYSGAGASQLNGYLCPPPQTLMCAISELESDPNHSSAPLDQYLQRILECKPQYAYPGVDKDQLFTADYIHPNEHSTCEECHNGHLIQRKPRASSHPRIFYGLIASGNRLMRSAYERDKLGKEHNVLCFEMEGAGIMNSFPCLIIRGICDYADSHKNKTWQHYASAAAAAYAKLLLSRVRTTDDGLSRKRLWSPDAADDLVPEKRRVTTWEPPSGLEMRDARFDQPDE
ncbi:Pfs domain protein [Aspergillus undulatus]|uniref:Pfs domain protein n=1 Tax=Aspergillus undulatus TaxID=1810928 RepID=UPI003CCDC318